MRRLTNPTLRVLLGLSAAGLLLVSCSGKGDDTPTDNCGRRNTDGNGGGRSSGDKSGIRVTYRKACGNARGHGHTSAFPNTRTRLDLREARRMAGLL